MRKIWVVIRREFMERVKSKWFLVGTVLGPVLMAAMLIVPAIVANRGARERVIAVLDVSTSGFGERVARDLDRSEPIRAVRVAVGAERLEDVADSLAAQVSAKAFDGFLIVTDQALDDGRIEYRGTNVSSPRDMSSLSRDLEESALTERLTLEGVDPEAVRRAKLDVRLKTVKLGGPKGRTESGEGSFVLAYMMWFVLYIAIILYGASVMGSVVEEKTSRVIEVLISSLRPFQLLAGKVIGVGAVGMFQMGIWGACVFVLTAQQAQIMRLFNATPDSAGASLIPQVSLLTAVIFLSYFLLGYFLYAAMFAAVAAMSNSEAEARQAQTPIVMLLVVPSVLMIGILNDPNGTLAVTLGLVPFFSPIAMPVRWAAAPIPLSEVVLSLAVLTVTLVGITWVAARIYRIGILMYGKRPTLPELWRWVRTS
jgi:ABC-2 type transport system permease protein